MNATTGGSPHEGLHRVPSPRADHGAPRAATDPWRRAGDILAVVVLGSCLAIIGGALAAIYVLVVVDQILL